MSKKMYETLKQSGHSGCITGICRLNIPRHHRTLVDWINDEAGKDGVVTGTFSIGETPLGNYRLKFELANLDQQRAQFRIENLLEMGQTSNIAIVEITTEEFMAGYPVHEFKAILTTNKRN